MLVPGKRLIPAVVAVAQAVLSPWVFAQQKNWKDRGEYDLVEEIKKAQGAKKIELLNSWKQKYPTSDFKAERSQMVLTTYFQELKDLPKAFEAAKEMIAEDPKGLAGLYWATFLTISMNNTSPDVLDTGEKAAAGLLENADAIFAADKKPANVSDPDWQKQKKDIQALAHTTLGWIAMNRKATDTAKENFIKALELVPGSGQVSFWLGDVILKERKPETQAQALYHFARAGAYDGPGALDATRRGQVMAYLEKVYSSYHGSKDGLDQMIAKAKAEPLPPADFTIKSAAQLRLENEEKFKKENPMLALWFRIKEELTSAGGAQYFESTMKGAALPGGVENVKQFRGKVVSHKPAVNPKEILVAMENAEVADVTLKLADDEFMRGKADPGTEIGFEGVPQSYTANPLMVVFEVEKAKITGWPAPAPAKPAPKKAGGKAAPKK